MGIILGLAAAGLYGTSDFVGGFAARRLSPVAVSLFGSIVATLLSWAALLWSALVLPDGSVPTARGVAWGLLAGLGGGTGGMLLYRGLSRGQMSVVGPISAVNAAVIPVVVGFALGERPAPLTIAGMAVALPAIGLVATSGTGPRGAGRLGTGRFGVGRFGAGVLDGLGAGVAFAVLFIALARAGQHAGLWPVACDQSSSLLLCALLYLRLKGPRIGGVVAGKSALPRIPPRVAALATLAGGCGASGTLLFFFSTHVSLLATAAVLVSLYPGVTVLLARVVLHERLSLAQRVGLGLCAFAVAAIAAH
jgi:drug/metabolite transporter (DMT)-like permease